MKEIRSIALAAGAAVALAAQAASALEEMTVAYFLEWPMPFQHAKVQGAYDEALGVKVNWVSFESGTAMSAAMASGDVQMAVSQGATPVVVATSAGQDLQVLDVAISYADNDNCVVAERHEIDQGSAKELEGKKVGLPQGTTAHFGFLRQMQHFGVDVSTMEIVDMAPADGAAAFAQGGLDMVCGWGGALQRMKEHGNVLLTGAEKEALGILVFDVTSAPAGFIAENPDLVAEVSEGDSRCEHRMVRRRRGNHAAGDRQGCGHGRGGDGVLPGNREIPGCRRAAHRQVAGRYRAGLPEGRGRRVRSRPVASMLRCRPMTTPSTQRR